MGLGLYPLALLSDRAVGDHNRLGTKAMKPKAHIKAVNRHPLSNAIDEAIEDYAKEKDAGKIRGYLGMSSIGKVCSRQLWYGFRFASPLTGGFPARTLRNFEDGHRTEDLAAERIQRVEGVQLLTETVDQQYGITAIGGHYRGHVDGFIKGVPSEDSDQVFLWENKCCSPPVYNKLKKLINDSPDGDTSNVLNNWNMIYYIQAIVYMHYFNLGGMDIKEAIHTVDGSGGREETLVVKTKTDQLLGEAMEAKARTIIFAKSPDDFHRIASDASAYDCTFCDHKAVCHAAEPMQLNCRTCIHSEPLESEDNISAEWRCNKHQTLLTQDEQLAGCEDYQAITQENY